LRSDLHVCDSFAGVEQFASGSSSRGQSSIYTLLNADSNRTFFSLCFNDWQCDALHVRFCAWRALNSLLLMYLTYCWQWNTESV